MKTRLSLAAATLVLASQSLWLGCGTAVNELSQPAYRVVRLHYENASGEKGVTTYDYNDAGLMTVQVWELLDGSRFSLNRQEYDSAGRMIAKHRVFSDGKTSSETYEYDANGNLLAEHFERSDSVFGTAMYEYDEAGRPTHALLDNFKGWLTARLEYRLDSLDRKASADIHGDTSIVGEIDYDYDSLGNLVREHWDFGGRWSQTFIWEYEPVPNPPPTWYTPANPYIGANRDYRVKHENYDYSGETGGPSYYTYSPRGKLTDKKFARADGLTTETVFLYDARGWLTRSYRLYSGGQAGFFRYEFDPEGWLVRREFFHSEGGHSLEEYRYDPDGKLSGGELDNFDTWLTGSLTFEHDAEGHLAAGTFAGRNGFDAELEFGTDSAGNPIRIHWTFSHGGTQTYEFEYEPIE